MNPIVKNCPNQKCKAQQVDIEGALIINKKSFNLYRCNACRISFQIERTKIEQKLTQKFIDASKISLK